MRGGVRRKGKGEGRRQDEGEGKEGSEIQVAQIQTVKFRYQKCNNVFRL